MSQSSKRHLAAVLFADIVGYTSFMQKDEAFALQKIKRYQALLNSAAQQFNGQVLKNYGDGSLMTFPNSLDAVKAAKQIQEHAKREPIVPLRIGIHVGEFVVEEGDIYGNGVNLASRIESLGITGAVLFSKNVFQKIKNHPELQVQSLGYFEFKNVEEPMEVFSLANEGFPIPKKEEIQGKFNTTPRSYTVKKNKWVVPVIAGALLLFAIGFWKYNTTNTPVPIDNNLTNITENKIPHNSLAVLPFTNMSDEKENQYFTDGMHDDLLIHLSKTGSMKVISRTSVLRFKETQQPIPEIAKMLKVANILEGSVRRLGKTVRINVQLIKAETDEYLWSEIYDRELTTNNIFDIQTEIAQKIAASLKTNINLELNQAIAEVPTENIEAYENYLKARQKIEIRSATALSEAKTLLEKSIAIDPNFALAYIHLGGVYNLLTNYDIVDKHKYFDLAWENLNKGMILNNNLAEAYALKGELIAETKKDLAKASMAFDKAISLNPNYETTYHWYANAVERLGKDMEKALEYIQEAVRINPLSPVLVLNLGRYFRETGKLQQAAVTFQKGIDIEPTYSNGAFWIELFDIHANLLGQVDSAAIYILEGIKQHGKEANLLYCYFLCLKDLKMVSDFEAELEIFNPKDKVDSILYIITQLNYSELIRDFDNMIFWGQQANQLLGEQDFDLYGYYLKKDHYKYTTIYEKLNPELKNYETYITPFELDDLGDFLQYIYCLRELGQTQKANKLWDKHGAPNIEKPIDKDETLEDRFYREYLKIRYEVMQGQYDAAMQRMDRYFENGCYNNWQQVLKIDPIINAAETHPKFIEILKRVESNIARQRENLRNYIKGKD